MPPKQLLFGILWQVFVRPQIALGSHRYALGPSTEFILVSQPAQRSVTVTEVNALTRKVVHESRPLITTGLREPSGLAVDPRRQRLYVADPKSHKVFMYELQHDDSGLQVKSGKLFVAVRDMSPRWVTVDERGHLFCTDEGHSVIAEISVDELSRLFRTGSRDDGKARAQFHTVYSGKEVREVNRPGGIAVEGNRIYWGNRARGGPSGSLLSAPEDPKKQLERAMIPEIQTLTKNVDKVFGVCASPSLVFYTGGKRSLFGVKQETQHPKVYETINLNRYALPRGCVWDGDGTVFVADQGSDVVWSFPSSAHNLGRVQPAKVFSIKDPFGIAVFRPRTRPAATIGFMSIESGAMRLVKGCAFQTRLAFSVLVLALFCGRDALF